MNEKQIRGGIGENGEGQTQDTIKARAIASLGTPRHCAAETMARFWAKVKIESEDGCWEWTGCRSGKFGYGCFGVKGKLYMAHRLVQSEYVKDIPEGLLCCHVCDNPVCVNPTHIFIGTYQDNFLDAIAKNRIPFARGNRCGQAKLSPDKIARASQMRDSGMSYPRIAKHIGVTPTAVSNAVRGVTWKHLKQ